MSAAKPGVHAPPTAFGAATQRSAETALHFDQRFFGPQRTGGKNLNKTARSMQHDEELFRRARLWLEHDRAHRVRAGIDAPNAITQGGYRKEIIRLLKKTNHDFLKVWNTAAETAQIGTWKRRRAAIKWQIRKVFEWTLSPDQISKFESSDDELFRSNFIKRLADCLTVAQLEPEGTPFTAKKRQTKARGLSRLPIDWQQTLTQRMPKYREAIAVTAISGCRPAELVLGVLIEIEANQLVLKISGAKVTRKSGQEWRKLVWDLPSASPLVTRLSETAQENGGTKIIRVASAATFSTAIRDAGERIWPKHRPRLTAYSLRHAAASEFKKEWGDVDDVSVALGHRASDTKGSYGRARFAKNGASTPNWVEASQVVRNKSRSRDLDGESSSDIDNF